MKMNKGIAVALAATIIASGGGFTGAILTATPAYAASTQTEIDAAVAQILNDTNAQRTAAGLKPLQLAPTMSTVSQAWTLDMAAKKSMTHNPYYASQLPLPAIRLGENVAQGYKPNTVVAAWMASEGHRANILGDYTHIGLGYWVDETGRAWFTQNFGKYQIPNLTAVGTPTTFVSATEFTSRWTVNPNEMISDYVAELYASDGTFIGKQTIAKSAPEVTFTGLSDQTTYTVKLKSHGKDSTGQDYYSPVTTYTVTTFQDQPTVTEPTGLDTYTGLDTIEAVWSAPDSIHGDLQPYKVEIKEGATVIQSATTADTNYTFTGLKSNTDYTVTVTAVSAIKDRVATSTATASARTSIDMSEAAVSEPTDLTLSTPYHYLVSSSWSAPAIQTGTNLKYLVTLKTAGKPDTVIETNATSWGFSGLTANTAYTVEVKASIESWDGMKQVTTLGVSSSITTPEDENKVSVSTPTTLTANTQATQATLNWTAPTVVGKINNYTVFVKAVGKPDRVITTPNANASYTVTGLTENTSYTFEVKANAASANGMVLATSAPVSVTATTPYAPSTVVVNAPTNVTATPATANQIDVAWDAPTGTVGTLTGYQVTLKETFTGAPVGAPQTVTGLGTSFTGLKDNTSYTVEVAAQAVSPDSTKTAVSTVAKTSATTLPVPGDLSAPNAPTGLAVSSVFHNTAALTWAAPTGIIGGTIKDYIVTIAQAGQPDRILKTVSPTINVTDLTENTAYTVTVAANVTDGQNTVTTPAASVSFTTAYAPSTVKVAAPTGFRYSTVAYNYLTAGWAAPTGTVGKVVSYTVVLKLGTTVKGTYTTTATSYRFNGLASNTRYTVEVKANAVSADGLNKATSTAVVGSATTAKSPVVSVAKPALTVSGVKYNGATVTWKKPAVTGTITGYNVQVKLGTRVLQSYNVSAATYSKTVTGLAENTSYVFVVQAYAVAQNGINKASSYNTVGFKTGFTAASTVKVSAPPLTLLGARTSINAIWTKPYVYGKILNYTVTLKQGTTVVRTLTTTGGRADFYSLKPGTTYTVSVRANAVSANGKYRASATTTKSIVTRR